MNRTHAAALAMVALGIGFAAFVSDLEAQTGDTRNIQVTASVKGSCRFDATPNINFGDLDPSAAVDKSQAVSVSFKCTKGAAYTLTVGNGLNFASSSNRMKHATVATDFIPYTITPKTQAGTG